MCRPYWCFTGRAQTAGRNQGTVFRYVFGLHKHFGKCRMCVVGSWQTQYQFNIGSQFNIAATAAIIIQRYAPYFTVIFARYQHIGGSNQAAVMAYKLSMIFFKDAG